MHFWFEATVFYLKLYFRNQNTEVIFISDIKYLLFILPLLNSFEFLPNPEFLMDLFNSLYTAEAYGGGVEQYLRELNTTLKSI